MYWHSVINFNLKFLLVVITLVCGVEFTIDGFTRRPENKLGFDQVDAIFKKSLYYFNQKTKVKTDNEILNIIKLLKQTVSVTSLFEQFNNNTENDRTVTAENSQKLKIS